MQKMPKLSEVFRSALKLRSNARLFERLPKDDLELGMKTGTE